MGFAYRMYGCASFALTDKVFYSLCPIHSHSSTSVEVVVLAFRVTVTFQPLTPKFTEKQILSSKLRFIYCWQLYESGAVGNRQTVGSLRLEGGRRTQRGIFRGEQQTAWCLCVWTLQWLIHGCAPERRGRILPGFHTGSYWSGAIGIIW